MRENLGTRETDISLVRSLCGVHSFSIWFLNGLSYSQKSGFVSLLIWTPARKMTATKAERHLLKVETRLSNSLLESVKHLMIIILFICTALCLLYTHTHAHSLAHTAVNHHSPSMRKRLAITIQFCSWENWGTGRLCSTHMIPKSGSAGTQVSWPLTKCSWHHW